MSTDMGPVISAVDEYGDQRHAEGVEAGKASRQPEVDEAVEETSHYASVAEQAYNDARAAEKALSDHMATAHPVTPEPDPDPEPPTPTPTKTALIGMSAPSSLWSQRLAEVGPAGVKARRIFADLTRDGRDQASLIEQAVSQGMVPVISYKVPSVATMKSGGYDSWLEALRSYLAGLNTQVTATFWHEPNGDFPEPQWSADFRSCSQRFLDRVRSPRVAVGPILNGFLLDNRVADFTAFTNSTLMAAWDFVGIDSYQSGNVASPGTKMPARAIPLLEGWLASQGQPAKRIVLGEYNGHTSAAIRDAGETILSSRNVWIACAWNSTGDSYSPLTGDRLTAYKATKADPRAAK